ncbi:MAG TPA: tetratricopeptide repeat protein [Gemmatimonadales bacterium]|nr:tetratricopeptide repeat protein [Gemmatimonadales bacterium]
MPVSRLKFESLPHAIFLQRVSGPQTATTLEARLGQGAFLALRLVDLLGTERPPASADAFHYQWVATDRFCRELRAAATEGAHVHGVASSAADAHRLDEVRLIAPALFAYAHFLEDELRLEEAIDVLTTLLVVVGSRLLPADVVAAHLRFARVHRKLNRFDEAEAAYAEAGDLATASGDRYSALLSRIGRANSVLGRGNLAEAERRLQGILADARTAGEQDAEARAEHGIAVTHHQMGQAAEAIVHAWRAFELYEEDESRMRALSDLGLMLLSLGDATGAERALSEVVRRGGTRDSTSNAMIELMHCASFKRDHIGFARWRERCEVRLADMPANILADFYLKQGIGQARFGRFRRAEALMKQALEIASGAGLHEFEFRIERIVAGLRDCEQAMAQESQLVTEPVVQTDELREVSESLAQLVG